VSRDHAKNLRKNLTDVERFVWQRLRSRRFAGFKFRRQMPLGSE
jgi:very-short-patch-repair endonuclease